MQHMLPNKFALLLKPKTHHKKTPLAPFTPAPRRRIARTHLDFRQRPKLFLLE